MMWVLVIFVILGAVGAVAFLKFKEKKANAGRLAGVGTENAGGDSQFWKSAKSRQSYRKSTVQTPGSDSDENHEKSDSTSEAKKPEGGTGGSGAPSGGTQS